MAISGELVSNLLVAGTRLRLAAFEDHVELTVNGAEHKLTYNEFEIIQNFLRHFSCVANELNREPTVYKEPY